MSRRGAPAPRNAATGTGPSGASSTTPGADAYVNAVNGPLSGLARALGLPRPAPLRRFGEDGRGQAYLEGPVLVIGTPGAEVANRDESAPAGPEATDADVLSRLLLDNGFRVHRKHDPAFKYQAIVVVLTQARSPQELSEPALALASALRSLETCGRIITVSPDPAAPQGEDSDGVLRAATARAVTGLTRSLAHESRAGWTANGIVLGSRAGVDRTGDTPVGVDSPGVACALWFLLSAKSAYVHGQFITIASQAGTRVSARDFATTASSATPPPGPATAESSARTPAPPLAGNTAVVTGAARGIGAAIARVLHRDGARVVGVDIPAAGQDLAATMNAVAGTAIQVDITAPDAAQRIAAAVGRPIDVLVNNAGITRDKMLANMDRERWDSVIAVNLLAEIALIDGLTAMGAWGSSPHVVGLASTSGIAGNKGQTNYAAAKAGVIGATAAEAARFAALGGSINAVAPGFIETDMTARMPALRRQIARRVSSLGQGGLPLDVAETVAFLASDAAGGINGTTLRVCGQNIVGE